MHLGNTFPSLVNAIEWLYPQATCFTWNCSSLAIFVGAGFTLGEAEP